MSEAVNEFPIVEKFGGRAEFKRVMEARGHDLSPGRLWHWRQNGCIAGTVILDVMKEADARRPPIRYSAADFTFLKRKEDHGA